MLVYSFLQLHSQITKSHLRVGHYIGSTYLSGFLFAADWHGSLVSSTAGVLRKHRGRNPLTLDVIMSPKSSGAAYSMRQMWRDA